MEKTCGSCKHYIGGGDWNLCCNLMYDLCYEKTKACEKYEYSEDKVFELQDRMQRINNWIEEQRRKYSE